MEWKWPDISELDLSRFNVNKDNPNYNYDDDNDFSNGLGLRNCIAKDYDEVNQSISNYIDDLKNNGLNFEKSAFEKINYINSEFQKLVRSVDNNKWHEHGFNKQNFMEIAAMMSTLNSDDLPNLTIDNVILPFEQYVKMDTCGMSFANSCNYIENDLDQTVVGHLHSHGEFGTFYSSFDRSLINQLLDVAPLEDQLKTERWYWDVKSDMKFTYGVVINNRQNTPHVVVNIEYPEYDVNMNEDGNVIINTEYKKLLIEKIPLNIVGNKTYNPTEQETKYLQNYLKTTIDVTKDIHNPTTRVNFGKFFDDYEPIDLKEKYGYEEFSSFPKKNVGFYTICDPKDNSDDNIIEASVKSNESIDNIVTHDASLEHNFIEEKYDSNNNTSEYAPNNSNKKMGLVGKIKNVYSKFKNYLDNNNFSIN